MRCPRCYTLAVTRTARRLRLAAIVVAVLVVLGAAAGAALYAFAVQGLPDANKLADYAAPLPSTVRANDGTVLTSFSRERRLYLTYDELPPRLVQAYISAEDKDFFRHGGIDVMGIVRAAWTNLWSAGRPKGASTITQQVAKNLLLNNEVSYIRKLKEAILARRIEAAFTKQQILELYLNQIFLGRNSYGVEAAAQSYFGKSVADLDLAQDAYLAILPKAPSTYSPTAHLDRALARRDYVLRQMTANGYIGAADAAAASAEPLVAVPNRAPPRLTTGDYFLEDVRRDLIARFGETPAAGRNSVYGGGLWVRTSLDPTLQAAAEKALRDGLVRYDHAKGFHGAPAHIDIGDGWPERLVGVHLGTGYADWYPAVILGRDGEDFRIGFTDGTTGTLLASTATSTLNDVPAARLLKPRRCRPRRQGPRCLRAASDPGDQRRLRRRRPAFRARAGDGRRLRRARVELQPRDAGAAPAGVDVQADRLCHRARQRLHAELDRGRRAVLRLPDTQPRGPSASRTSAGAMPGRRRCAGASNSRAT